MKSLLIAGGTGFLAQHLSTPLSVDGLHDGASRTSSLLLGTRQNSPVFAGVKILFIWT